MTLKLRHGVSTTDIEYGIAVLDEDSGRYWNLNPTGALVLRTLLDGGTPAQAADLLSREYAVDADSASKDVDDLLRALRFARLVEQQPAGGAGDPASAR
jgi:hypothetical protein